MSNILQIGYTSEGTTDQRFLSNIIRKTFENAVLNCFTEIEVYEPEYLKKEGDNFAEQIKKLTEDYHFFHVICIHCDSDNPSIDNVLQHKFLPAIMAVDQSDIACKNLVKIIPVQMTEAWLLADTELLISKLNTNKNTNDLGLPQRINQVEKIANPKELIQKAIQVAQSEITRRRRKLSLSSLYSPISQELSIDTLKLLPSYMMFWEEVNNSLRYLNYMR